MNFKKVEEDWVKPEPNWLLVSLPTVLCLLVAIILRLLGVDNV